jgi:hypothetical protein
MSEQPIEPYRVTANLAIQCRQPNGQIGDFLYSGASPQTGILCSPMFTNSADLFTWARANNWQEHGGVYVKVDQGERERDEWCHWLRGFTPERFYDEFVATAQGAESECVNCGEKIYLDMVEGGGVPDWKTGDGYYVCDYSWETSAEGTGGHCPLKLKEKDGRDSIT